MHEVGTPKTTGAANISSIIANNNKKREEDRKQAQRYVGDSQEREYTEALARKAAKKRAEAERRAREADAIALRSREVRSEKAPALARYRTRNIVNALLNPNVNSRTAILKSYGAGPAFPELGGELGRLSFDDWTKLIQDNPEIASQLKEMFAAELAM